MEQNSFYWKQAHVRCSPAQANMPPIVGDLQLPQIRPVDSAHPLSNAIGHCVSLLTLVNQGSKRRIFGFTFEDPLLNSTNSAMTARLDAHISPQRALNRALEGLETLNAALRSLNSRVISRAKDVLDIIGHYGSSLLRRPSSEIVNFIDHAAPFLGNISISRGDGSQDYYSEPFRHFCQGLLMKGDFESIKQLLLLPTAIWFKVQVLTCIVEQADTSGEINLIVNSTNLLETAINDIDSGWRRLTRDQQTHATLLTARLETFQDNFSVATELLIAIAFDPDIARSIGRAYGLNAAMRLKKHGETITTENLQDIRSLLHWTNQGDTDFSVESTRLNALTGYLEGLAIGHRVSPSDSLSEYLCKLRLKCKVIERDDYLSAMAMFLQISSRSGAANISEMNQYLALKLLNPPPSDAIQTINCVLEVGMSPLFLAPGQARNQLAMQVINFIMKLPNPADFSGEVAAISDFLQKRGYTELALALNPLDHCNTDCDETDKCLWLIRRANRANQTTIDDSLMQSSIILTGGDDIPDTSELDQNPSTLSHEIFRVSQSLTLALELIRLGYTNECLLLLDRARSRIENMPDSENRTVFSHRYCEAVITCLDLCPLTAETS